MSMTNEDPRELLEHDRYRVQERPTFRPDEDGGRVYLEGEFDFPVDAPGEEVAESLCEISEHIGGFVNHSADEQAMRIYHPNALVIYVLRYGVDEREGIDQVDTWQGATGVKTSGLMHEYPVEELKRVDGYRYSDAGEEFGTANDI